MILVDISFNLLIFLAKYFQKVNFLFYKFHYNKEWISSSHTRNNIYIVQYHVFRTEKRSQIYWLLSSCAKWTQLGHSVRSMHICCVNINPDLIGDINHNKPLEPKIREWFNNRPLAPRSKASSKHRHKLPKISMLNVKLRCWKYIKSTLSQCWEYDTQI